MSDTEERATPGTGSSDLTDGRHEADWRMPREFVQPPPPAPPFSWPVPPPGTDITAPQHDFHHPLDRVTGRLPRRMRIAVDWIVTIVGEGAVELLPAAIGGTVRVAASSTSPEFLFVSNDM